MRYHKKNNSFKIALFSICILIASCTSKSEKSQTAFLEITANTSNILFSNTITDNDSLTYSKFPYIYNGGGVAIGDINNDGLSDVFFTGNMVPNKLYLNKGNLKFDDISDKAGVSGDSRWYTGVAMTDINNDGFLDIYLSVSGVGTHTENQLLINNGDNTFTESASKYGINDSSNSIQSTFFDYDNDGDIDLFVANYPAVPISQGNMFYDAKMKENNLRESGHLYRNDGNGNFSNVTQEAGVQNFGLTLGLIASDFNNDGWQDLYLSNDFNVPDYFYINNQDGTFKEVLKEATGHVSMFAMGIDASDFNNDGLTDLIQVEMSPEDYVRARVNMASMNPQQFEEAVSVGFHYQYMQNSLQLNNGVNENNIPIMSEISRFANMASTDWSWSTLFADLDNDGWKDIYITNGMKRDVNDNDVNNKVNPTSFKQAFNIEITDYPSEPIANYVYRNMGGIEFEKKGNDWGLDFEGFSNGMAYGDLDNDGDLDLVINNIDKQASLFKNETTGTNYLRVALKGPDKNPLALGAKVSLLSNQNTQTQEMTLTRGFQSSMEPILHFGLGANPDINKIKVLWPDGTEQVIKNPKSNQLLVLEHSNNTGEVSRVAPSTSLFNDITTASKINFKHSEDLYDDYQSEPLLPYKYSMLGGALAVGDANGDGLEDFFAGNATGSKSMLYLQNNDGTFTELDGPWLKDVNQEDISAVFYDFDNDGDQDLYVASGGSLNQDLTDRLYLNTEEGFIKSKSSLPQTAISTKAIAICDFDKDGLMDLFVGGRNVPGKYPVPATSVLLRNLGGKNQDLKFEIVKSPFGEDSDKIGMVTDAVWADLDGDSWEELILTGEWMPITVYQNNKGHLTNKTEDYGFENTKGWWYSLHVTDVDNDGDLDIVAGNLGLNYKYKSKPDSPFEVYSADFDENGSNDIVFTYNKKGKQVPLRGRECSSQQVPAIAKRYKTFREFAKADLQDIYGQGPLSKALHYKTDTFAHLWFENKNGNSFLPHELPVKSQLSSVNSIASIDYNNDEYQDLLLFGNLYQAEAETPKSDAGLGLVLIGSADGFSDVSQQESGLFFRDDIKNIRSIKLTNGEIGYLLGANNNTLKLISFNQEGSN
ncbi:VCBS repeat-containing protein [Formosa sp. PL04]|uniref:VCBS repeat-containing protein n=1 Tax=Formosa sp. PL04 TaxID=3081755 RepID=UPI002980DEC0|nr:VCBS repeat-containing protein [Formosa sp. PL04]MDW5290151.1 VCBS repeat-containing protein [Formosa sp. PL04]